MTFYEDVTNGANRHHSLNLDDEAKKDAFALWQIVLKASPKRCIDLTHTWTRSQEWAGDKWAQDENLESEFDFRHCKTKWNFKFANNMWALAMRGNLLKQDWKVNSEVEYVSEPANNEGKMGIQFNVKSPEMSGVKARINIGASQEIKDTKTTTNVNANFNCKQDDKHFGMAVEHDTKEFSKIEVQAAMGKAKSGKFFTRVNVSDEAVSVGLTKKCAGKCHWNHSYMAQYMWGKEAAKAFMGQPLVLSAGGVFRPVHGHKVLYSVQVADKWQGHARWFHKLDKQWKVAAHQHFDSARVGSKQGPYDLGFELIYKL